MKVSRRSFLRSATAVTVPYVIPSQVWAAATKPNDRLTMGFIGMGKQNGGLLRNFLRQNTQVLAVCEVDTNRRENAARTVNKYYAGKAQKPANQCATYTDFRELIARDDIDAVCIATPDHWHAIPVIQAARAGKDIYCEKPLSLTIHEARRMADVVREEKRVFQTGSQQRSECGGRFHRACELIRNGRIGDVQDVYAGVGDPSRYCDLPEEKVP